MAMLGEVALWACVAIGVFVGGMLFVFFDGTVVRAISVFVLAVLLGLVLRQVFGGGAED